MYIPPNLTEEQVVKTITTVAKRLFKTFRFGYQEQEDFVQQAVIIVITSNCLQKYDPKQPLENFLSRVLRNRFYNFKRDNFARPDPPCVRCPLKAFIAPDTCTAYDDKEECDFYARWLNDNASKKNIINPTDIGNVSHEKEKNMSYKTDFVNTLMSNELRDYIMTFLSVPGRKTFIMMINNAFVPAKQRNALREEVSEILENSDVEG